MDDQNKNSSAVEKELSDADLKSVRNLLFGDENKDFSPAWNNHGFCFKLFPPYRLEQMRSGPCGVIAAVAAHVIDELIFGSTRIVLKEGLLRPTLGEKKIALSKALTQIIWRARSGCEDGAAIIVTKNNTEKILFRSFSNEETLYEYINTNITLFKKKGGISLFMYSLLLTRGIENIKSNMDFPDTLIGGDAYASQEIVNLILTGHAVTNVFNGNKELGENVILKGISEQSRIGLLSLSEYENNGQVGSYFKNPEHPIWVLNANHHYLVLFGTSRKVLEDTDKEFHLFYTDSLFAHPEISLEINPKGRPTEETDALPATIRCVLTRWPSADIKVKIIDE